LCISYITVITRPKVFENREPKRLFGPTRAKGAIIHPKFRKPSSLPTKLNILNSY